MTTPDILLLAVAIVVIAAALVALRHENKSLREEAELRRRLLAEHNARISSIGYGPPQIVRRSPPLTEEQIIDRACETPAERRARKANRCRAGRSPG